MSGGSPIAYVQSNVGVASPATTLAVNFTGAQAAGDLNVVLVNWFDSPAESPTITDTKGNVYTAAVGPTHFSSGAGAIYYAKNIVGAAAGSNTVTVTFSASVTYLDVRVAEYSGINTASPFDVGTGATGTSTAMSSGSVTTMNANDLLVAGDYLNNATTAPGTGFTQRQLSGYSSILEDEVVSATGSYAGTATQGATGWWDMQVAAFKGAGGGGSAPNPPTGLGGTAASSSQINLTWTDSTSSGVTANLIERCSGAGCTNFAQIASVAATATTYNDAGLTPSTSYSYRMRATNASGLYSTYTSTSTVSTPAAALLAPTGLGGAAASSSQINLTWTDSTSSGVTANLIERCSGASCTAFAQIASVAATATTYSDTGLSGSTSYSYRLRVTNAAGAFSGYTSTVTASTAAAQAPTTPTPAKAVPASSSQITLTWGASTDPVGVTAYLVESCTGAGCSSFAQIASVAGTATTYSVTGLVGGTSYSYRVRATNAAGLYSGYSPVVSATAPTGSGVSGSVTYGYDALGRLVEMASPTLNSVQGMTYDAAGNVTANTSTAISAVSIAALSASQASVGQQITIDGAGFSTTPSSNTVTINGVAATPVSSTASQIVVTVPSGATSGAVKVTVGGVLVTSTQSLSIVPSLGGPTVTGFSPAGGPPGTAITIAGTNFSTTAANDKVLINGTPAVVTAATATSLTVTIPTDVASGPVQVVTPFGVATGSTTLIVPPSGYALTNISASATVAKNGGGVALSATAANPVLVFFNGTEGDTLDKVVAVGGGGTWYVLDPHGFPIATSTVSGAYFLPTLDVTGTYTVEIVPAASGTYTVYLTNPQTGTANLTWGQETAPTPAIYYNESGVNPAAVTQQVNLSFTGAIGQLTEVDILNISGTWTLSLVNSTGTTLWTSASFSTATVLTLPSLLADGSYALVFDPGLGGGSLNYNAGINPSASLTSGSTVTVNGGGPTYVGEGPTARVAFSGTAGQAVTLSVGVTRGFFYGLNVYYLQGSSQTCLISCGSGNSGGIGSTSYISLPYTGTYIAYLYFASSYPSSADLRLSSTIPLSIGASPTTVSVGASTTTGLFTNVFPFTAGNQSVTFHDSCSTYWALLNSSGTVVNANGGQSGSWSLGTLVSGTYTLVTGIQQLPSVGSSASDYQGNSSGNWPTTTSTCTLQLTSP